MADKYVTQEECQRSHDAIQREQDKDAEGITNLWSTVNTLRNHLPPWAAGLIAFESLVIGALATIAARIL